MDAGSWRTEEVGTRGSGSVEVYIPSFLAVGRPMSPEGCGFWAWMGNVGPAARKTGTLLELGGL
jgi:hypothetical protein